MFRTDFDENTKLWSSVDIPPIFNTNVSMGQILLELMRLHGSKVAQVSFRNSNVVSARATNENFNSFRLVLIPGFI